ncbi:MAG: C40 family peptidase [Vicinamibacterales bacterium]
MDTATTESEGVWSQGVLWIVIACLWAGGCASAGGGSPRPFPVPGSGVAVPPGTTVSAPSLPGRIPGTSGSGVTGVLALVSTALDLQGIRYRWGGSDPNGFDCSGFTQYVFARHGVTLPREVHEQYREGRSIRRRDIRPGDLLFFSTTAPGASHVAIALGDDEFVHAPSSRGVVRVERLSSGYWAERFIGARRIE